MEASGHRWVAAYRQEAAAPDAHPQALSTAFDSLALSQLKLSAAASLFVTGILIWQSSHSLRPLVTSDKTSF